MKGKILITGSSGFIGRNLKEKLLQKEYSVIDFNSTDGNIANIELKFEDVRHVFHLAAKTFIPESWEFPKAFYDINVSGTLNVLEFCRQSGAGLTFLSSYVYGIPQHLPVNETHPVYPANPYAHSKILAENLCLFYTEHYKVQTTIVRLFNVFGAFQHRHFLIPKIISQLVDPNILEIELMDLTPKRDFLYLEDFLTAIIGLFERNKTGTYNLGSGKSLSVEEVIEKIMKVALIEKKVASKNMIRKNEIPDVRADISKIKSEINWEPKYSFEDGIREIIRIEHGENFLSKNKFAQNQLTTEK